MEPELKETLRRIATVATRLAEHIEKIEKKEGKTMTTRFIDTQGIDLHKFNGDTY